MPNKTEVIKIIKLTRVEQAIMLTGIHGIGKSSIIASEMAKEGYTTITLFLGQKADPGDIIGHHINMKLQNQMVERLG